MKKTFGAIAFVASLVAAVPPAAAAQAEAGRWALDLRGQFAIFDVDEADLSIAGLDIEIEDAVGGEAALS